MMIRSPTASILFFLLLACLACQVKQPISYYDLIEGRNLERVSEIPLDSFLGIWMERIEEHWGMSVKVMHTDSAFTYFRADRKPYFKVNKSILDQIGFSTLDEQEIGRKFYNEVIPLEDREKHKRCGSASIDFKRKYRYIEHEHAIEIRCRYKVKCEFLFTVVNKDYIGFYDLISKSF